MTRSARGGEMSYLLRESTIFQKVLVRVDCPERQINVHNWLASKASHVAGSCSDFSNDIANGPKPGCQQQRRGAGSGRAGHP